MDPVASRGGRAAKGSPPLRCGLEAGPPGRWGTSQDLGRSELGSRSPILSHPKVSILVTAYGQRPFLRQALESITRQTADPQDAQIVLVANKPSSFEVLREVTQGTEWA